MSKRPKRDRQFESPCILSDESQTREKLRRGRRYLENGELLANHGTGTYESIGKHRWRTVTPNVYLSDGCVIAFEGDIDLATRTWTGKLFEKS